MTTPAKIGPPDQSDLLARIGFLRDRLDMGQRFTLLGKLLLTLRDNLYPHMHILSKADGTVVVTISRPQAGDQ